MKSVKEIKEIADRLHERSMAATTREICDTLIAITERLEALNPTPPARRATECDICAYQANTHRAATVARREGMIEALRWVNDRMPTGRSTIAFALDRIENGGDL